MSFRRDHDAALARVDALEREKRQLEAENARLREQSERSQPSPPPVESELGKPTFRWIPWIVLPFSLLVALAKCLS